MVAKSDSKRQGVGEGGEGRSGKKQQLPSAIIIIQKKKWFNFPFLVFMCVVGVPE